MIKVTGILAKIINIERRILLKKGYYKGKWYEL